MLNIAEKINKGWGFENIWVSNDKYCGKFMYFKSGASFSMHFHVNKDETWNIVQGVFQLHTINTTNAARTIVILRAGDIHRNKPLEPHKLVCVEEGIILEVSTADHKEDNYRIEPGDSQTKIYS